MAVDLETAYHVRQAFVDLGLRPPGATIEPPPLTREMIRRDVRAAFASWYGAVGDLETADTGGTVPSALRDQRIPAPAVIAAIHEQHPD